MRDAGTPRARRCRDSALDEIRGHDAILLGAIGDPSVPSGVLERGLLLKLRFELDHYVNLRPSKLFPGVPTPLAESGRHRLRRRPRGHRRPLRRQRRRDPRRHAAGSRHRGQPEHRLRCRARRPRRLRPRTGASAQEADAGPQEQRPRPRRPPLEPHGRRRRRPSSRTSPSTTCTSTPPRSSWSTDPSRFDVIVTDNLFGDILTDLAAADHRWHRPGRQRQHQPRPHHAEHVRAGPRVGSRHRRSGQGRPDRGDPLGRRCCSTTSACPRRRPRSPQRSRPTSPSGAPAVRTTPEAIGEADRQASVNPRPNYGDQHDFTQSPLRAESGRVVRCPASTRSSRIRASGCYFTDHMFLAEWTPESGWADARVVPYGR